MNAGDNHPATLAAVPPANPSRERTAAAVQLGTVATAPASAPHRLVALFLSITSFPLFENSKRGSCAALGAACAATPASDHASLPGARSPGRLADRWRGHPASSEKQSSGRCPVSPPG